LTVPGLPVCLWWRSSFFPPPHCFEHILRVTNHLLLDSARFSDSEAELPLLLAAVRKLAPEIVVTDLNWARITPWRELTAQLFDSPETRPYLDWLREIRMEYHRAAPEIPARRGRLLLFTGWLASRLGWEPVSHSGDSTTESRSFRFRSRAGIVDVEWAPREYDDEGAAVDFCLMSESASGRARFALASALGRNNIVIRLELPGRPPVERIVRLAVPDEVELVNEELKYAGRDRIYEKALAMIARLTA
jgi:glucose-6-phosphate dehydrogenase assembly protein OpcA